MQHRNYPRFANMAAVLTSLLAVTSLLAGSWQARAQTPSAAQVNRISVSSGGLATVAQHTPSKVLDGTALRVGHYNPEQSCAWC